MSERRWGIQTKLRGAGEWLWWWVVEDSRERLQGRWEWTRDAVPKATAIFIERWLGLWFSLLFTALLGMIAKEMFQATKWASYAPTLFEPIPKVVVIVSLFGLFLTLALGLLMFAILTVTGLRVLSWLQNVISARWEQQTAPFEETTDTDDWSLEPAPTYSREEAKERVKDQVLFGLAILLTVVTTLLIVEQEAPNQLNSMLSNPNLTAIGKVLDTAVLRLDVGSLLWMTAPEMTQAKFVLSAIIVGLPGIPFLFAARNLLYLFETEIRKALIKVRDDGLRTRAAFYIGVSTLYLFGSTIAAVYQILTGG